MTEFRQHPLKGTETLVFDLDDTLYPLGAFLSHEKFLGYVNEAVSQHLNKPQAEVEALTAKYLDEPGDILNHWELKHNVPIAVIEDFIDAQDISHVQACEQTREFLSWWQGRAVIFTNAHLSHTERFLEHLGLKDHIEHVCSNCQRGRRFKPDPDIYHELTENLGENPENCIMFEDRHINLRPAYEMGMGTVLIHPEKDEQAHVQLWYPDMKTWIEHVKIQSEVTSEPHSQTKRMSL